MNSLEKMIEDEGARSFSAAELGDCEQLFAQRAALYYTPTSAIPPYLVGSGPLEITLPIPTPTDFEVSALRSYKSPRFWVDLLQRATGMLRWTPFERASITVHRYDTAVDYNVHHLAMGTKALTDALKVQTTGRADGRLVYYFGAIVDDNPHVLVAWNIEQHRVAQPWDACCRLVVRPA